MNENELNKQIVQFINEQNSRSLQQFDGYSSADMHRLLYQFFSDDCPVRLKKMPGAHYERIPIYRQVFYLARVIENAGELKLTKQGSLPVKVVKELYDQEFLKDDLIEQGIYTLYKESSSLTITLTRILIELTGLAKKRNGKLSLTVKAKTVLTNPDKLLRLILETFATKFNWGYFDGYPDNGTGQIGVGYTFAMLAKYGHKKRQNHFYADKYFRAFPNILEGVVPSFGNAQEYMTKCYCIRTFNRFLLFFGLIEIEALGDGYGSPELISTTSLFAELIEYDAPQGR